MKNIHVISTDKLSRLGKFIDTNNLFLRNLNDIPRGENVNIYITNDEEIREGDYSFYPIYGVGKNIFIDGKLCFYIEPKDGRGSLRTYQTFDKNKKIILTTDEDLIKDGVQAINNDFLQWFVKNPICENIEVIYGFFNGMGRQVDQMNLGQHYFKSVWKYKIIIPKEETELNKLKKQFQMKADEALELNSKIGNFGKEEPKQKTLEEAAEWFSDDEPNCDYEAGIKTGKYQGFVEGAKYMQKRMYSEEDMREAIRFGLYGMYGYTCGKEGETDNQINKYLKQFKKE